MVARIEWRVAYYTSAATPELPMKFLLHLYHYLRFVARRCVEDRCLTVAGSMTYTSLLALVPLFTVSLTLAAQIPATRDIIFQVRDFILKNLLPDVAGRVVSGYMEQFAQNATRLTVAGLLIIFFIAVTLLFTIDSVFNDIWRARRRRSWWKRLAGYLLLMTVGPLLIGASLSISSYFLHLTSKLDHLLPFIDDVMLKLVAFMLTAAALVIAYRVIPNRYVPARHALAGGLFAAFLFELTKYLFVAYVARVPTYRLVYGAFASVPIFLVWLYCCWMVVLIGAEVTATFSYFRHIDAQRLDPATRLLAATRLLDALARATAGTELALDFKALRLRVPMPIDQAEDILDSLVEAKILANVRDGRQPGFRLLKMRAEVSEGMLRQALERRTGH
jgi:membrane protein